VLCRPCPPRGRQGLQCTGFVMVALVWQAIRPASLQPPTSYFTCGLFLPGPPPPLQQCAKEPTQQWRPKEKQRLGEFACAAWVQAECVTLKGSTCRHCQAAGTAESPPQGAHLMDSLSHNTHTHTHVHTSVNSFNRLGPPAWPRNILATGPPLETRRAQPHACP